MEERTPEELEREAITEIDAMLKTDPGMLKSMLADKGRWLCLCDMGWEAVKKEIKECKDLAAALSVIALETGMEPVTEEEAEDMFIPNLTINEFYHLAQCYFSSLCSTLDYDDDWGGLLEKAEQELQGAASSAA
eukprot:TRINITY_DN22840_c0_g1_i1.p1 TRINITY_DN22840_c0_g1~~TRINITY_DN22840_c0_g1_i1.p1  ORF type:complete len:148 (+),score=42.57 TRINITY_DN22840_c0_g1_i1:44-445(+)